MSVTSSDCLDALEKYFVKVVNCMTAVFNPNIFEEKSQQNTPVSPWKQ
jgi:hypothetical protein